MKQLSLLLAVAGFAATPGQLEFFEKKVRPILVNNCFACHSAETKPAGNLRVDDRNGLLRGGDSGPAVVPGDPAKSIPLERVQHDNPRRRMPKEGALLTATQIGDLRKWIEDGAAWPVDATTVSLNKPNPGYDRLRARHWAYQPVVKPALPSVVNKAWPQSDIDQFLLGKLEEKQLAPVADASAQTLIRRLTYDLTGLPPTPAELARHETYEVTVDRLLASPRFGERWGRHWLDVARYGESSGPSRNIPYPHAWRYRDYVIDAVNRDIPNDRFLREQIAGDLLPAATPAARDRLQIATGFLALGPKDVNQRFKERFLMDNAAEQVDTLSRSTLAMTVGCARCHDHKFDPIPTADYYALAGIFTSTDDAAGVRSKMGGAGLDYYDPNLLVQLASYKPKAAPEKLAEIEAKLAIAKKEWDEVRGTPEGLKIAANGRPTQQPYRLRYEKLQGEFHALTDPANYGGAVHGLRDAKQVADTAIRIRGEAERLGPVVPRGFLTAFQVPGAAAPNPAQSGRLELADWIASPNNPLTARVAVNRVWQHLFGEGLVKTVDNFGLTGDRPSHPELLDYLAVRFVEEGWSVKRLVRHIVLSRAYRLSSEAPAAHREVDPANRLLWRHSPRRLDAEEVRDSLLAATGRLQLEPPAGSPASELKMIEIRDNGPESRALQEKGDHSVARSIYLPLLRGLTPRALEAFDPVTQTLVTGQRDATTVPTQALFLLNSGFVRRVSLSLAERLLNDPQTDLARLGKAYKLALNRAPTPAETDRALTFVAQFATEYQPKPIAAHPPAAAVPAKVSTTPINPDNIDRTDAATPEEPVQPANATTAAWMHLVQALFASAEFRFIR